MARRLFNGNAFSENGWPYVDEGSCTWLTVPGTDPPVHLQIQNGVPLRVMGAFAADINAYVEHVRDGDSACWTAGNSVSTSNHPGGTAMDIDWELHPFQVSYAGFNQAQIDTCRALLDFYEGMIFWGQDWNSPKDCMHWQMGYDTYDKVRDQPFPKCQDFISRKIRSDGFSMFRRGTTPELSRTDRYALAVINEGRKRNISPKGIQIALTTPFVESGWKIYANSNVPESLNFPHDAVGSDHDSTGLFQQRQAWGPLSVTMDPAGSAGLFYDGGRSGQRGLTDFPYDTDERTPGGWAQAVQVSAFPDRYDQHWGEAVDMYNRLSGAPPPPPPAGEEDMAQVPQEQWDRVYRELTQLLPSLSSVREPDEGPRYTMARLLQNLDANEHLEVVRLLASYGHQPTIALLKRVAAMPVDKPGREGDSDIAKAVLHDVMTPAGQAPVMPSSVPVAYTPPPAPVVVPGPSLTTGQVIGRAYDALEDLRLADALPIEARAPLAALISVLQTKNGSAL